MNKLERRLKGQSKFKKRLKNYRLSEEEIKENPRAHNGLRTSGQPCSCYMCRPGKYDGKPKNKYYKKYKNKLDEE